jgi:hypothetical protein
MPPKPKPKPVAEASEENADAIAEATTDLSVGPIEFEHGGRTWVVESDARTWPAKATIALAQILDAEGNDLRAALVAPAHMAVVLEGILAGNGWADWLATNPTSADLNEFWQQAFRAAIGAPAGE